MQEENANYQLLLEKKTKKKTQEDGQDSNWASKKKNMSVMNYILLESRCQHPQSSVFCIAVGWQTAVQERRPCSRCGTLKLKWQGNNLREESSVARWVDEWLEIYIWRIEAETINPKSPLLTSWLEPVECTRNKSARQAHFVDSHHFCQVKWPKIKLEAFGWVWKICN